MFDLFACNLFQDVLHQDALDVGCRPGRRGVGWGRLAGRRGWLLLGLLLLQSGLVAAPVRAVPIISELFYDAVGADNGQSFVELAGVPGSSLDGMTLEGINGSGGAVTVVIELWGEIPEDGLFVLADYDADGLSLVSEADQLANFDFCGGGLAGARRSGRQQPGAPVCRCGYRRQLRRLRDTRYADARVRGVRGPAGAG